MNIYISSSWKNRIEVRIMAEALRKVGHEVYDFTDPSCRPIPEIPPERYPKQFDPEAHEYDRYLRENPEWLGAVQCNRAALAQCDLCVLLLPCGMDAHADWGVAVGMGKKSVIIGHPNKGDRTPSHLWANAILRDLSELLVWIKGQDAPTKTHYTQDEIEEYAHKTGDPVAAQMMRQLISLTRIKAMSIDERDEKLGIAFNDPTGMASFIAEGFLRMLKNYGAENYLEMSFRDGEGQELILTAHKPRGITAGNGIAQIKTALFDWYFKNSAPPSVNRNGKLYKSMDEIPIQVVIQEVKTLIERRAKFLEKAHELLNYGSLHRDVIEGCASAEDAILIAIGNKGHRRAQKAEGELQKLQNMIKCFLSDTLMTEIRRGLGDPNWGSFKRDNISDMMNVIMSGVWHMIDRDLKFRQSIGSALKALIAGYQPSADRDEILRGLKILTDNAVRS